LLVLIRGQGATQWLELYTLGPYRAVNTASVIKTSQLMLYREIIAVCSEIHTKHINRVCGQNVDFYSNQNYI
jgi:hypothetical protein